MYLLHVFAFYADQKCRLFTTLLCFWARTVSELSHYRSLASFAKTRLKSLSLRACELKNSWGRKPGSQRGAAAALGER